MGLESPWILKMAAPGATATSRWLLPEDLERRDSCSPQEVSRLENTREISKKMRSEPLGPREPLERRDGCSQSLWSLAIAAPEASAASRWSLWRVDIAAPRPSGASRWPLPQPLEPRDCCSQSLGSLEIAGPRAPGASQWLLQPLELPGDCSQSLWSLQMVAASRKLSRRQSRKLRSSSKTPSSKALCD